jgi:hypothetical protein
VTLAVRILQARSAAAPSVDLAAPPAVVLLVGTLVASAVAGLATWRLTAPIRSAYRQGMLAAVSAFGTLLCSMIAVPIDHLFGRLGLLGLALAAFLGAVWLGRRLGRDT